MTNPQPKLPPPAIGLTVTGDTMSGTLPRDLIVRAGTPVTLRKLRPEGRDACAADYVIVFGSAATTSSSLEADRQAADDAWHRRHRVDPATLAKRPHRRPA